MSCVNNLTLVFSGTQIGDTVHSVVPDFGRHTAISRRPNFWSTDITLDGSYPDIVYTHDIAVYKESASPYLFAGDTWLLTNHVTSRPQSLQVKHGEDVVIDFGSCYMERSKLDEPDELLLTAGGIWDLQFVGTQIPSVSSL